MLEELKSEKMIKKVGGRFKLVALVQRRMQELLQGQRPLIDNTEYMSLIEIVAQEILQGKIYFEGAPNRKEMDQDAEPVTHPLA
jgi:DNA-directed RNA polymerase subunit K/omega